MDRAQIASRLVRIARSLTAGWADKTYEWSHGAYPLHWSKALGGYVRSVDSIQDEADTLQGIANKDIGELKKRANVRVRPGNQTVVVDGGKFKVAVHASILGVDVDDHEAVETQLDALGFRRE